MTNGTILSVKDLRTYFQTEDGVVKAVDGISFELKKGETLGIVGESGSGKSVTNLSVMRLIPEPPGKIVGGDVIFDGTDVLSLPIDDVRKIRGKRIAMIFQDPMTSLNPFLKISTQLMEVTQLHLGHNKKQAREHAIKMLKTVGIPEAHERIDNYPHEFSGGMRQRVMIAMALSCDPELLIADEPTTALDVTIQAQILELIKDLKSRMGTSVILITHDLGVVAGMTDKIIVMYAGKVFEQAPTRELFNTPANPYTRGLLKSVPDPADEEGTELYQIPGLPPDVAHLPPGCPFAERCYRAEDLCRREYPPFVEINEGHHSLCHFAQEVYEDSKVNPTTTAARAHKMKKLIPVILVLVFAVIGCKWFGAAKDATPGTNGSSSSQGGRAKASSDPKADVVAASKKFLELPYFTANMEGKGDKEIKSQVAYVAPDRFHVKYLGGTGAGMEMIWIGKDGYMNTNGKWTKMPTSNAAIPNLRDSFTEEGLKTLTDVTFEGEESVDGKPALVYGYKNVTPQGNHPFTSKIYVSQDTGVPMKIYVEYSNGTLKNMTVNYDTETKVTIEAPVVGSGH